MSKIQEMGQTRYNPRRYLHKSKSTENVGAKPNNIHQAQQMFLGKNGNPSEKGAEIINVKNMINEIDNTKMSVKSRSSRKDYDPSILEYIRNREKL